MKTVTAGHTTYCYACKTKIAWDEPHLVSRVLHQQMFYPRFHIECAEAKIRYETTQTSLDQRNAEPAQ